MTLWRLHKRGLTVLQITCLNLFEISDTLNPINTKCAHVHYTCDNSHRQSVYLQNIQINVNF